MLRTELNDALKQALKDQDKKTLGTVRLILAALKDRDIAARGAGNCDGISEDEVLDMLQKMVKQRRESIELYTKGERQDLVDKEEAEIEVIQRFMPQQLDDGETQAAVDGMIVELEAGSIKDMGRVMAALKERYAGRMDFAKASALAKGQLA
ncbi:GatB/YqeY domain-containing protein [Algihabitans albus]|uniref:GatB/YqeY domain-containing protein n=1 Tax=Algihabitans albus TaxID=2164067 RepID=UPI000E5D4CDB|nr:GatB/YqeY domain-containing protein [Algihabitans albus]